MTATLLLDQAGLPAGSSGFARTDGLLTGALVTLQSVGRATTHEARLLTVPGLDTSAIGSFTQVDLTTWTFAATVGVDGMYRVELVTDRGLASEDRQVRVFGIRNAAGLLFPSYGIVSDPTANIPDLSDPQKLLAFVLANELNEATVAYPDGNPFGYEAELDTILRAAAGGAGNQETGPLLWEWNGTDLSQFDAVMADWNNDIGSVENADSAIVRSVVADPFIPIRGNVIQMAATALQGHGALLVKASELTLPERYVVVCRLPGQISGLNFSFYGPMVYFVDTGGVDADGFSISRSVGFSNVTGTATVNDEISGTTTVAYAGGGTFSSAVVDRGGVLLTTTVEKRQAGETPAFSVVANIDRPAQAAGPILDTELPHTISKVSVGNQWDGLDMTRFGLWIGDGINGTTGTTVFGKFQVFAHPDD